MKQAPDAATAARIGQQYTAAKLAQKTATANSVMDIATTAASNGAPASVIDKIKKAKNPADAARIGQSWLKAKSTSSGGGGATTTTGADKYVNVTKTTDAGQGLAFFGKNKSTGKQEPIGAAVYSLKQGVPLDQLLNTSKNPADIELVKEIKKARAAGDSDETILTDLYNSGNFKHLFVGWE
jgi:hypothetical protein